MAVDLSTLEGWLTAREVERLEFKAARDSYSPDKLTRYMVALANEGGGHLVMGVTDETPRRVCGTQAYLDYTARQKAITELLRLRIQVTELDHPQGRVLVWTAPPHHRGVPVRHEGVYWARSGESLVPMTEDRLRELLAGHAQGWDFSAEICPGASMADLDPQYIARFRQLWAQKVLKDGRDREKAERRSAEILATSDEDVLADSSLTEPEGVTYAALVLVGRERALTRYLPQAEVIFEYRTDRASIHSSARENYRRGFLGYFDELWDEINQHNDPVQLPAGMLRHTVFPFNEAVVREGLLNAVAHRDYRSPDSVFVRQWPHELEIESPGGFPAGVTAENILGSRSWRNRRIAEALERCGLVERSGQGYDLMLRESLREAKPRPSFEGTTDHRVVLNLRGAVEQPAFLGVMEAIGHERLKAFDVHDFVILDNVFRTGRTREDKARVERLISLGVLERIGRGKLIPARRFYQAAGKTGAYTRTKGLERPQQKGLLLQHVRESGAAGASAGELSEVLPGLTRSQLQGLLKELRTEGQIMLRGERRFARWFPKSPDAAEDDA